MADDTLVVIPKAVANDDDFLTAILPLTDVMSTGHHAAVSAGVRTGGTVAVVGDRAVGLCGVLAAQWLGAERIIILGRHESRLEIARRLTREKLKANRYRLMLRQTRHYSGEFGGFYRFGDVHLKARS